LIVLATRPDPNGDGEVIGQVERQPTTGKTGALVLGPQEDQSDQPSDEGDRDVSEINRHEQEKQGRKLPKQPFLGLASFIALPSQLFLAIPALPKPKQGGHHRVISTGCPIGR